MLIIFISTSSLIGVITSSNFFNQMIILYKKVCGNSRSFVGTQPAQGERKKVFFFSSPFSPSRLSSNKTSIIDIRTVHTYVDSEFSLVCTTLSTNLFSYILYLPLFYHYQIIYKHFLNTCFPITRISAAV